MPYRRAEGFPQQATGDVRTRDTCLRPDPSRPTYRVVGHDPTAGRRFFHRLATEEQARAKAREVERLIAGSQTVARARGEAPRTVRNLAALYVEDYRAGKSTRTGRSTKASSVLQVLPTIGDRLVTDWTSAESERGAVVAGPAGAGHRHAVWRGSAPNLPDGECSGKSRADESDKGHQRDVPSGRSGAPVGQIRERPTEAEDRAVPGHWEGDLLFGKGVTAVATLVERQSRYLMLALPEGHRAELVADALAAHITRLPELLRKSLTWDQGKEMAAHARFSVETGLPVYFCDPRSPWQRASNENNNGLLRRYFPKRTPSPATARTTSTPSPPNSTGGLDKRWAGGNPSEALDLALR